MNAPITPLDRLRLYNSRDELALGPQHVILEITRCIDEDWSRSSGCKSADERNELTPAEARQLIDQLAGFSRPTTLVLCGGDPLVRRDIYALIEHAVHSGVRVNVRITATPLVTRSALRRLKRAGVGMVSLSLDGSDAESHDARHVTGSFDRTVEIIADAGDIGIATQVDTHVSLSVVRSFDSIAKLLTQHRVCLWSLIFPVPTDTDVRLTYEQYESAYERLWELARSLPLSVKTVSAPHYSRYVVQHQHPDTWSDRLRTMQRSPVAYIPSRINDGRGMMYVSHSGLVHPSEAMQIVCGVFPLNSIVDIYHESPIFKGLQDTNRVEGKCNHCEFRHICGGSRAHAFAKTGNPFAQDPDCQYVPRTPSTVDAHHR